MKNSKASRLLLLSVGLVLSQARVQAAEPAAEPLTEITVTASRVAREGFSAPTPTTVIGPELLEARAATNILDVINEQPAFRNTATQQSNSIGAGGLAGIDLRGLGTIRSLVLVNGRRHVPTSSNGTVNINLIPASLIERTEVVTGGASAAWGSDAVAGVVNLILKNDLQGLESNVSYGASTEGDYEEYNVSLAGGTSFADGRGHFMAGGEYVDNKGVGRKDGARDWANERWWTISLPANRAAGLPSRLVTPDVWFSDLLSPSGVINGRPASAANGNFNSNALDNIIFNDGGSGLGTFDLGNPVGGNLMVGGSNGGASILTGENVANPVERYSALTRVSYELSDSLTIYGEASFAHSSSEGFGPKRLDQANLNIFGDNPFLDATVASLPVTDPRRVAILGMTPNQSFVMGHVLTEFGPFGNYTTTAENETTRFVVGLEGKLGEAWSWDFYYQRGENNFLQLYNQTIQSNFFAATDAVAGPNGTIVCRSETAAGYRGPTIYGGGPAAGCVPINLFGVGSPSAAALAYVSGVQSEDVKFIEDAAGLNLSGEPFSNWAGPVSIAAGLEYRKDKISSTVDANSAAARYEIGNPQAIKGDVEVQEVYLETVFPLLSDKFLAQSLDLNAAGRLTDYSTSGNVETWKVGLTWQPVNDIRFRATLSQDIRAANLQELYAGPATGFGNTRNPANGVTILTPALTTSNPNLVPEEATTFTGGIVLTPSFIPGFRMSVDYFDIQIDEVISTIGAQAVVDRCFTPAGSTVVGTTPQGNEFCSLIEFGPGTPPSILRVSNPRLNLNGLDTSGIDFEFAYNVPSLFGLPGNLGIRLLSTYVDTLITTDSVSAIDRAGQTLPDWTFNLGFNYTLDRFSGNLQIRHMARTYFDTTLIGPDKANYSPTLANSISDNIAEAVDYVSLSAQYKLIEGSDMNVTLYGVVNNLTDQNPPDGAINNAVGNTLYDLVGRTFRVGARVNF